MHIPIRVYQPPISVRLVIAPPALIHGPIRPRLSTLTHADKRTVDPLAFILVAILHELLGALIQFYTVNKRGLAIGVGAELRTKALHERIAILAHRRRHIRSCADAPYVRPARIGSARAQLPSHRGPQIHFIMSILHSG